MSEKGDTKHIWKKWRKGVERCVRPGCDVLRKRRSPHSNEREYHTGMVGWTRNYVMCVGGSTADDAKPISVSPVS